MIRVSSLQSQVIGFLLLEKMWKATFYNTWHKLVFGRTSDLLQLSCFSKMLCSDFIFLKLWIMYQIQNSSGSYRSQLYNQYGPGLTLGNSLDPVIENSSI